MSSRTCSACAASSTASSRSRSRDASQRASVTHASRMASRSSPARAPPRRARASRPPRPARRCAARGAWARRSSAPCAYGPPSTREAAAFRAGLARPRTGAEPERRDGDRTGSCWSCLDMAVQRRRRWSRGGATVQHGRRSASSRFARSAPLRRRDAHLHLGRSAAAPPKPTTGRGRTRGPGYHGRGGRNGPHRCGPCSCRGPSRPRTPAKSSGTGRARERRLDAVEGGSRR